MAIFLVAGRSPGLTTRSCFLQREAGSLKEVLGEPAGADLDLVRQGRVFPGWLRVVEGSGVHA